MPEQLLARLKKHILPQWWVCFFTAMACGLIAHLYKLTNWLPNWDSLVFRYDAQNMISMGRWFLPVACAPSSFYDLPWLAGFLALILHGAGAICICRFFHVRRKITAGLIGALVITFPTVASVLMYNYVADGYALAFLFSCLAALFLGKNKPNYICAAVFIALSVGIYQAYLTVTVMLLLCRLIYDVLDKTTSIRTVLKKCGRFLLAGAMGILLYTGILWLVLKVTGIELLEYQGIGSAATLEGFDVLSALYIIKHSFLEYFFDFSSGHYIFGIINGAMLVLTLVLYLRDGIKRRLSVGKWLLLGLFLVLLPVGASLLAVVSNSIDYHNLMKMGFLVFYLCFILQYDEFDLRNRLLHTMRQWTVLGLTVLLVFTHVVIANVSYHKLTIAYETSFGILIRVADRIEQTDGASDCDTVLVLGALPNSEAYSANLPPDMTGTTDGLILRADDEMMKQSVFCSALNDYCDKDYRFLTGAEKDEFLETADLDSIGIWPARESIRVVDDVLVISLGPVEDAQ